jgi:hypothetical protein
MPVVSTPRRRCASVFQAAQWRSIQQWPRDIAASRRCPWQRRLRDRAYPPRRWERAYEFRRAEAGINTPLLLMGRDIDDMRTKAGVERAVVDVLRKLGMLAPAPPPTKRLRIVEPER